MSNATIVIKYVIATLEKRMNDEYREISIVGEYIFISL
jgi:hypothetical protein